MKGGNILCFVMANERVTSFNDLINDQAVTLLGHAQQVEPGISLYVVTKEQKRVVMKDLKKNFLPSIFQRLFFSKRVYF